MNKFPHAIAFIILFTITSCTNQSLSLKNDKEGDSSTIVFTGSTTVSPIIEKIGAIYMAKEKDLKIKIVSEGSKVGLKALIDNTTDFAMLSNRMNQEEKQKVRSKNLIFSEHIIAGDAVVFIININNPVKKLTEEQIQGILSGQYTNWKELGGQDKSINLISRDTNSGTYDFIKQEVLKNASLSKKVEFLKDAEELKSRMMYDHGSFSYTSFSNLDYSVDPVDVSFDGGENYIEPRLETINNFKYEYVRGLFLYYSNKKFGKLDKFLQILNQDTVAQIIKKSGYLPLNNATYSKFAN